MTEDDDTNGAVAAGRASESDGGTADAAGRQWRSMWRVHFYSGMFALPFILLMAITGLVILYTEPIQQLTEGDVRSVTASSAEFVSFDQQAQAVQEAYPDGAVSE